MPRFGGYARGAAVVILSDGLERGDPAALRDAVRRLSRARLAPELARTPLAAGPAFGPQTEALAAIRRFVDDLVDGAGRRAAILSLGTFCALGTKEGRVTDIVDAHHHIWRQADLPWLTGPMQPRIFGPYEPIRRDYPIQEFLEDLAGTGVHAVGLRADQLGQRRLRGRGRLGAADRRRDRLAARHRRLRRFHRPTTCARNSTA